MAFEADFHATSPGGCECWDGSILFAWGATADIDPSSDPNDPAYKLKAKGLRITRIYRGVMTEYYVGYTNILPAIYSDPITGRIWVAYQTPWGQGTIPAYFYDYLTTYVYSGYTDLTGKVLIGDRTDWKATQTPDQFAQAWCFWKGPAGFPNRQADVADEVWSESAWQPMMVTSTSIYQQRLTGNIFFEGDGKYQMKHPYGFEKKRTWGTAGLGVTFNCAVELPSGEVAAVLRDSPAIVVKGWTASDYFFLPGYPITRGSYNPMTKNIAVSHLGEVYIAGYEQNKQGYVVETKRGVITSQAVSGFGCFSQRPALVISRTGIIYLAATIGQQLQVWQSRNGGKSFQSF